MRPYDLAKSIFLQALDVPAEQRAAFLDEECAGDPELRGEVASLLAFHDETLAGLELIDHEAPPATLGGYAVIRELGRGGMGVVYLARRGGEPPVAIKALRPGLLSAALLARFRREAAALSRLDHTGIARPLDTGVDDRGGSPWPWLAMEYVEGVDLRAWAATERTAAERLRLVAGVCDAVQHAHEHGVVHRDLKPENILVRPDGRPVVLDFGVARLADSDLRATTLHTQVGLLVGTVRYMSPEQAEARPEGIGERSDVHALGVIAYELLTGRLPYDVPEHSVHRALVAVMTSPPRPMSELPAPLRSPLERVLRAALAKDPEHRTATAAALGEDLRRVADGRRPLAKPARERGPFSDVPWRTLLALSSGAVLIGIVLSAWRTPPTPADWLEGLVAPSTMFRRVVADIDSAAVRLHYTTRTLAREREALEYTARARVLLRTIGWRPYAAPVEQLALFRAGEAEYLIAERTNDVARYEAAAKLWYMSRPRTIPLPPVALPDTSGPSGPYLVGPASPTPWLSASMALSDAARIARPLELYRRSLEIALEGEAAYRSVLESAGDDRARLEHVLGGFVDARIGVCLAGLGYHANSADTLRAAVGRLRAAVAEGSNTSDGAGLASHTHELGVAELRLAAIARDRPALDSAFVHLHRAYEFRASLEGYTSAFLSRLELAQAERLAARLDSTPGAAARHLDAAGRDLALRPAERAALGGVDAALYAIDALGLELDRCCVARDTAALGSIDARLVDLQRSIGRGHTPMLQIEAGFERLRLESLRYALTRRPLDQRHAQQLADGQRLLLVASPSVRGQLRVDVASHALELAPRPFDLDYPAAEPF